MWRAVMNHSQGPWSIATQSVVTALRNVDGRFVWPELGRAPPPPRSDLILNRAPHTFLFSPTLLPTTPFPPYFKDHLSISLVFPALPGLLQSCFCTQVIPNQAVFLFRKALLQVALEVLLFQQNPDWRLLHQVLRAQARSNVGLGRRIETEDPLSQTRPLSCGSRRDPLFLEGGLGTRGEQDEIHNFMELKFQRGSWL